MVAAASPSFLTAVARHRAGNLTEAESFYRETLRADPRHSDALHLLGLVAFQRRQSVAAIVLIGQAIDVDRGRPEYHNSLGNAFRSLGRPQDAIESLQEALRLKPDFSEAYNNLGIVLAECGQTRGAVACFEQAARLDPQNAEAWMNLGSAIADLGDQTAAARHLERAISVRPNYGAALALLGRCRLRQNRIEEAIVAFERALAAECGETPAILKELAGAYLEVGRSREAEATYRKALEQSPRDPALVLNLAQSLKDLKNYDEAVAWYGRGIALDPRNVGAHYALGRALHLADRFGEAIASYERCLALGSKNVKAAYHLGNARKSLKQLNPAIAAYLKALEWDADFIPALYQLGNAYRALQDLDGARMCLERVLRQKPDDLLTLVSLGNVLKEQDDLPGAAATFQRVINHLPHEPLWELWLATLCPTVFHSTVGIDHYRGELEKKLARLGRMDFRISPEDITNRGCPPPYNLQFHGRDDRSLKEAYARVFRNCVPADPDFRALRQRAGKPRLGFVVTDGHEGVFLRYFRGVLERMDRRALDPVIVCSAAGDLRIRAELPADSIETFIIPTRFDLIVERMREGRFSVLYFWEVGSDTTNYFLPLFRLAPVQCTGAGVAVTTGLPQVDYYLSNDACEPEGAESAYTERLIRARSLLTWQPRHARPASLRTRAEFGVEGSQHFYVCPHKIEKFHPDFDDLLGDILARDPQGVLVVPQDRHGYAARKLHNRLRLTLKRVIERVHFVPYQTLPGYLAMIEAADVVLDPIHYGGGLTSFDALSLDKPIVTLPGDFARGRFTSAFYRTMGVEDCIAAGVDDYVELAVRLGVDRDWRTHVTERIAASSDALFEQQESVADYDAIFARLVAEAHSKI